MRILQQSVRRNSQALQHTLCPLKGVLFFETLLVGKHGLKKMLVNAKQRIQGGQGILKNHGDFTASKR